MQGARHDLNAHSTAYIPERLVCRNITKISPSPRITISTSSLSIIAARSPSIVPGSGAREKRESPAPGPYYVQSV